MRRYPGGGAFALFFHPHPREFATQNKKKANARGLARGGGWAQLELTDALAHRFYRPHKCILVVRRLRTRQRFLCFFARAGLFKAGLSSPKVNNKFEFRFIV